MSPDSGLHLWQDNIDNHENPLPWNLFPIAYQSHGFLFADTLGAQPGEPCPLWYYAWGDQFFVLYYPSLAALFRTAAELIELSGTAVPTERNPRMSFDPWHQMRPRFDAIRERHLTTAGLASILREVPADGVGNWPVEWQRATGVDAADTEIRGATHTVVEFLRAALTGPVTARLQGRAGLMMGPVPGPHGYVNLWRLTDATGTIGLALPETVPIIGVGDQRHWEVEVTWSGAVGDLPGSEHHRQLLDAALSGDRARADELIMQLIRDGADTATRLPVISRIVGIF